MHLSSLEMRFPRCIHCTHMVALCESDERGTIDRLRNLVRCISAIFRCKMSVPLVQGTRHVKVGSTKYGPKVSLPLSDDLAFFLQRVRD